ncbi:MAG: carbohydrate-binding family V/XII [Pseudomonadota bacterium]
MPSLRQVTLKLFACALLFGMFVVSAHAVEWPQEITADEGTIIIYQPQPDKIEGNRLFARAAMSIELKNGADPIFGAMWIEASLETNRANDTAQISNIEVTKVTWPDSKDTDEQRFTQVVEQSVGDSILTISLTQLSSALAVSENVQQSLDDLNTDPPNIIFSEQLAVLLLYDGDPRFTQIENSPYERAQNTPLAVARKGGDYYLTSGNLWYEASDPLGPWQQSTKPPADLVAMVPKTNDPVPTTIPTIMTATVPTELVVTQGKPDWVTLTGGKLLYVENTETPWIRDLASGNMYVQLSGRWFRASKQEGPWTFVRADKLPDAFSEIPPASDIGGVRTSVAGTIEANEAIADASIPQTTAIKRDQATLAVRYDGDPKFEAIKGTDVAYAVNTSSQVLRIDGAYYAVDEGVWFTSSSPTGPWSVADNVPSDKIAQIPPTSPVYNTTYVHIYDATPSVVYVGYTPGYLWSFPYYGVPVYGTGWYYPPYWGGGYYYPRTPTWGFHMGYNPWTGWNFGVSWGGPFFRVGVSWGNSWGGWGCCGGWYGGGYRHNDININTGDINIGNNVNIGNRRNDVAALRNRESQNNLYDRPKNKARNAPLARTENGLQRARSNPDRKDNLFADRQGQVARRDGDDWQVRQNDQWERPASNTRDLKSNERVSGGLDRAQNMNRGNMQRPQFDRRQMNREFGARKRGNMRRRR